MEKFMIMSNVGEKTARLMMSKPGSFFVFEKKEDIPVNTCKKFGIELMIKPIQNSQFKIVKRI
jgi:hypothetical protein